MRLNVPMILTLVRLLIIPIFVVVFYLPWVGAHMTAGVLFTLAAITDWLDGYLARKWNQTTRFGAFLDPVVDKLMVVVAIVLLVGYPHMHYIAIPAAIIIGREITISALREWMAEIGKRTSVRVSFIGKVKTTFQFIAIVTLLASYPLMPRIFLILGYITFYIAAGLTLWTMCMYLKASWSDFGID